MREGPFTLDFDRRLEPRILRYDHGLGDRLREGWHGVSRGVRRMLHRGYDRRW